MRQMRCDAMRAMELVGVEPWEWRRVARPRMCEGGGGALFYMRGLELCGAEARGSAT